MFTEFLPTDVPLFGVEPAGRGLSSGEHGATLGAGTQGIFFGAHTYNMQDEDGQINESYSVSAGLDFPSIGPQHAYLKDTGRVNYISATDTPVDVSEVQGKIIIMPDGTALDGVVYEDVTSASEGLFAAKMAGLWGFVNATTGQQAVPFVYEAVRPFNEGLAAVKTATGWGYINTSGAEQTVMTFENAQSASGGKAWVKTADGWGVALLSDWKA